MDNEFWAAIAGSVVGGVIAFGIQLLALRENRRQRDADVAERKDQKVAEDLNRKRTLAYSLVFKAIKIHSNIKQLHLTMERLFSKVGTAEPWQFLQPFANLPNSVIFSTDEMTMLFSLKESDLFNRIILLDETHNNLIEILKTLNRERANLTSELHTRMMDGREAVQISQHEFEMFRPKMLTINDLATEFRAVCREDALSAERLMNELVKAVNLKLGLSITLEPQEKPINLSS